MLRQSSNAFLQRLPLLRGMSSAAPELGAMTFSKASEESQKQDGVEVPRTAQSPLLALSGGIRSRFAQQAILESASAIHRRGLAGSASPSSTTQGENTWAKLRSSGVEQKSSLSTAM